MKKLCVLFPGIGYHCEKPLLYYLSKLAKSRGYEVIALRYDDFPKGAKGNADKMRAAAAHALMQSEQQLRDLDFADFKRVVFIGKSIGTAACLAYREAHLIKADCLLLTPLTMTFEHSPKGSTAFHGTADQWAETAAIERLCSENSIPLYKYENANHSLETGDVSTDIRILTDLLDKAAPMIE